MYFGFEGRCSINWASLVAQTVKNPLAVQETWVRSLGWEDPLEKGMATHSSILAWRIPMDRGAWWATVQGSQRVGDDEGTKHSTARKGPSAAAKVFKRPGSLLGEIQK